MKNFKLFFKSVLTGTLIVVCLCSCGKNTSYYLENEKENEVVTETEVMEQRTEESVGTDIYVYVCGQVQMPGVYVLPEGSRVCDAFQLAGGLTAEAAQDYWNQARILKDGEMIYVPTAEELENTSFQTESMNRTETNGENKVNINTASKETLMSIPGIGETRAMAIISYRQENGPFTSIEELKEVEGIKEGVLSKIKDYIVVN